MRKPKISKKYLSENQEVILSQIARDFQDRPITFSVLELAQLYNCSFDNMRRIFNFLRYYDMVEFVRCGWRRISILKARVYEFLRCPLEWIAHNSEEVRDILTQTRIQRMSH